MNISVKIKGMHFNLDSGALSTLEFLDPHGWCFDALLSAYQGRKATGGGGRGRLQSEPPASPVLSNLTERGPQLDRARLSRRLSNRDVSTVADTQSPLTNMFARMRQDKATGAEKEDVERGQQLECQPWKTKQCLWRKGSGGEGISQLIRLARVRPRACDLHVWTLLR